VLGKWIKEGVPFFLPNFKELGGFFWKLKTRNKKPLGFWTIRRKFFPVKEFAQGKKN